VRPLLAPLAALVLAASLVATAGRADPSAEDRTRAATLFDDAVAKYSRAEFGAAARGFFDADGLAPSTGAITNAIEAARRAGDFVLVARAAERAIGRGAALVLARTALADAATRLARIELSCSPAPCSIAVDGAPTDPSEAWFLPGTHTVEARSPAGAVAHEQLSCVAGATYRAALSVPGAGEQGTAAPPVVPPPDAAAHHGLPRAVFFGGVGVTAVLAAVTVWSGVEAIAAKNALSSPSTTPLEDNVRSLARRTDWLLLGAGLAGVATAVVGVWFTDWHPGHDGGPESPPNPPGSRAAVRAALVPLPGGAALTTTFAF
jgi:hypothetical protein